MRPSYIMIHTAASIRDVPAMEIDDWHRERNFRRLPQYMARRPQQLLAHFGYHHLIRRDGVHEVGRFEDEPGEHCRAGGMNQKAIAVCMGGYGDVQPWTQAQWTVLRVVLLGIYSRHPLIAAGGVAALIGHREVPGVPKRCPGALIRMDDLRLWYERHIIASNVSPIDPKPLEDLT